MKTAVPLANGKLAMHFGHCESFTIVETDDSGTIVSQTTETPPPHEPGVLPAWLHGLGVTHVIAGGMGSRAQGLFASNGITVVVGAPAEAPETLVRAFIAGDLISGDNVCDH